ncbi:DsbA family protein [Fodinibius sp. Rm-B-1B1-1]|uniref:DsbA family protein n=1 Tax=Fodinibius alkaliphilus TaxID=3140241 RepID=UPI00315AF744
MNKLAATVVLIATMVFGMGIANTSKAQEGPSDEPLTIVEYSDYQCPACAYFHPIVEKLKDKYGDQIEFEMKYFPLNSHQYAALAARAAQSAKNQGKFYEMHSLLFENQNRWSNSGSPTSIFINYARELGLDINQFKNDLNASETQKTVMEQRNQGRTAGVNATPTFFIEGEKVDPLPRNFQAFDQLIQQHLD